MNSSTKKKDSLPFPSRFIYDTKTNKVMLNNSKNAKIGAKIIPDTVNKFMSPNKTHIFEKNNNGNFIKTKNKEVRKTRVSRAAKKETECSEKGKLIDPITNECIEDTPYNRIIINNKKKNLKKNSPSFRKRSKSPPLINRKVKENEIQDYYSISDDIKQETCISRSKVNLREHQLKCVKRMLMKDVRGIIASFGVGTGKTLTAVATAECLLDKGVVKKVVVSSPKSLLNNFKKELIKYNYGVGYKGKVEDDDPMFTPYEFITHDGIKNVLKRENNKENGNKRNEKEKEKDSPSTHSHIPFLLIVDEAHEFRTNLDYKKIENKKSSYFLELALLAKKVLLLTATPFVNQSDDLINLINAVKGGIPEMLIEYPSSKVEKEAFLKNTFMFFDLPEFEKAESGMPSSEVFIKRFIMSPKYYNQYMEIEKGYNVNWQNPTVFLNGLRQASNVLEGNPKIEWIIDRIVKENALVRTLIYSSYLDSGIKLIQKSLVERGIKYVEITGELSSVERENALRLYNEGEINIFFITKAGGSGLDLKRTQEVILLESNWNNSNEQQIIGRAIRIGSHIDIENEKERHVMIFKLVLAKPAINDEDDKKEYFKKNKLYKGSADEIIQFLNESKKDKENEILRELREYAYE